MTQHISNSLPETTPDRSTSVRYAQQGTYKMTTHSTLRPILTGALLGSTALISAGHAMADMTNVVPTTGLNSATVSGESPMAKPMLNAGLGHGGFEVLPGAPVTFATYWNYDSSINWAAIRIFNASDKSLDRPIAIIPVKKSAPTQWTAPDAAGEYVYVLRVDDGVGHLDETRPRPLIVTANAGTPEAMAPANAASLRQDNTAFRNIPIKGLTAAPVVTVRKVYAPKTTRVLVPAAPLPKPDVKPLSATSPVISLGRGTSAGTQVPISVPIVSYDTLEMSDAETVIRRAREFAPVDIYVEGTRPLTHVGVAQTQDELRALADAALNAADIRMSYDGLTAEPMLNAGLVDGDGAAMPGETVKFAGYWNYNHWINRAELRIYDPADTLITAPLAIVPLTEQGEANWTVPESRYIDTYSYVLRVYDAAGNFDETREKLLRVTDRQDADPDATSDIPPIYGEDNTAKRNIAVKGGTVTVSGKGMNAGAASGVEVFGNPVRLDQDGDFAVRQIVPPGAHMVDIAYLDEDGTRIDITRDIDIPEDEWFVVAIGDLTIGKSSDDGRALLEASGEEFDETYVHGRAAFYLKGKVKGDILITAAMDTLENDIDEVFNNLDAKNPQSLIRRLDPDRYYPVYGDDSTYFEDAPTQGKFYVRIERGDDEVVWGNFLTDITNTEFAQIDRGLYGGKVEFNSDQSTSFGERRMKLTAFAADPGTIPAREEYRGTGGSVYFLENQDITIGSERVRVEIRDEESGLVVETRDLRPFVDYEIDYIQGRILLAKPLSATELGTEIVRDGTLSGRAAYLVTRYEFAPTFSEIDGFSTGGRAEGWVGENVRIGVTAQEEETADADQSLIGADIILRADDDTFLKAEIAQTDGQGFGERASIDGGFTYDPLASGVGEDAQAVRVEAAAALERLIEWNGRVSAYYEQLDEGFSAPGRQTPAETTRSGGELRLGLGAERSELALKLDELDIDGGLEETTVSADVRYPVADKLTAGLGLRYNDIDGSLLGRQGERTDLGVELEYDFTTDTSLYVFGQGTVDETGNRDSANRFGLGGKYGITEQLQLGGEVSGGDGGTGALGELNWLRNDGESYYLNYTLDAERREPGVDGSNFLNTSQNTLTAGGKRRLTHWASVYGEERASFGDVSGLTHAYGLDITPTENISLGASFEIGDVEERERLIEREAYTATAGYTSEAISGGVALELREDTETGVLGIVGTRDTWLLRSNVGVQVSENWRALAKYNKAESNNSGGSFFDGEFVEAQIGAAYRPVDNNRLNALVRYTYFEDLPGAQQVSNSGQTALPAQKSNIFNVDANYRLTDWLTLGGKYGHRSGEVSLSRLEDDFVESSADLFVVRGDFHIVKEWDAVLEGRMLEVDEAGDSRSGVLAAIYRHVGDNAKVGVGYNFTDFSDDLTDLDYNDDGVFLNVIAKF